MQIFSTQGIIVFNIFKFLGNWELKSLLHPVSVLLLICTIILFRIYKFTLKITLIDLFLFLYFSACFLLLIYNTSGSIFKIYISFREVFLLTLLVFLYQQVKFSEYYWNKILKLLHVLVLANLFFIALTYILGPEDYMKFLTGRYRWGIDPDYKFKISSFLSFWRSPGLMGSPGNIGYFGLISYFLFDQEEKYKKKKIFAITLAIVGFVRSVYLVLVIYWILKFLLTKKNLKIIKLALPYILPIILVVGFFLYNKGILDLHSIFMRFEHWANDITVSFNVIFGGGIGLVGGAARGQGFLATLDNYWLLMLISVGLIGIISMILFFYEKVANNNNKYILFGFLVAGLFITLSQGISFLVLFPLLFLKKEINDNC